MKKSILLFLSLLLLGTTFHACSDSKTYAEMLKEEKESVKNYISRNNIQVIKLADFLIDTVTGEKQYVLLENGIYMHIVNRGDGNFVENNNKILARFTEVDVATGDTILSNTFSSAYVDIFSIRKYQNTIYGTFDEGYMLTYGSPVPTGWLVPLSYVKPGKKPGDGRAHIKVIVPSKLGQNSALKNVQARAYDLVYQLYQ